MTIGNASDPHPDITDLLRKRLRAALPEATDEQVDGLLAAAKEYGEQLREARNHANT